MIPYVIERRRGRERVYDIFSRLLKDRIVFIGDAIGRGTAIVVQAQLLHLANQDEKKPIQIYINSPGGNITDGLAIYDAMKYVPNTIETFCIGQCASMAAVLLAGGTKGHRYSLPHSQIMIHQPWGGAQGTASDIAIQAENILKMKKDLIQILAEETGQPADQIEKDTDRDRYLTAEEAKAYGLIDEIISIGKAKLVAGKSDADEKASKEAEGEDDGEDDDDDDGRTDLE